MSIQHERKRIPQVYPLRKERVPEPQHVEDDLRADLAVEEDARTQLAVENQERETSSVAQLFDATFHPLQQLREWLREDNRSFVLIMQIEDRLHRYLGDLPQQATEYAQGLSRGQLDDREQAAVNIINGQVIAELQPLLRHLYTAMIGLPETTPTSPWEGVRADEGTFMTFFRSGRADANQRVPNLFSLLTELSLAPGERIRRVVVTDPLRSDADNTKYWHDRLHAAQLYGSGEIPTVERQFSSAVSMRTMSTAYECEQAATRAQAEGKEKIAQAYHTLAQFLESTNERVADNFPRAIARLDFLHGHSDDVFDVLNAAEMIKHHDPQLFARILGVGPSHEATSEAGNSDLYGNAFQIALYRTLHARTDTLPPAYHVMHARAESLTDFTATQLPLQHINRGQFEELQKRLVAEVKKKPAKVGKPSPKRRNPLALVGLLTLYTQQASEYQLQILLDGVAMAEQNETFERLRVCGPKEFRETLRSLPPVLQESQEMEDLIAERIPTIITVKKIEQFLTPIITVLQAELKKTDDPEVAIAETAKQFPTWEGGQKKCRDLVRRYEAELASDTLFTVGRIAAAEWKDDKLTYDHDCLRSDFSNFYTDNNIYIYRDNMTRPRDVLEILTGKVDKKKQRAQSLLDVQMWMTASDESVLSGEWYKYLGTGFTTLRKISESNGKKKATRLFIDILQKHPNISDQDWKEWYQRMYSDSKQYYREDPYDILSSEDGKRDVDARLRSFFLQIEETEIAFPHIGDQFSSRFFTLASAISERFLRDDFMIRATVGTNSIWDAVIRLRSEDFSKESHLSILFAELLRINSIEDFVGGEKKSKFEIFLETWKKRPIPWKKVIERLSPQERRLFLEGFFNGKNLYHTFNHIGDKSWKEQLLELAEEFIPNDPGYKDLKKSLE